VAPRATDAVREVPVLFLEVPVLAPVSALAPRPSETRMSSAQSGFHPARVEEAASLKRGDRWKRRLPKVLW
jgi:hypothetical protein